MASLHMDTEVAHATQSTLANESQEISVVLYKMLSQVNKLQNNWTGNSASQFFQEFAQWHDVMGKMIGEMKTMTKRLQQEIVEWEQVAERF
jgi:WXG100 family type VII secretion target